MLATRMRMSSSGGTKGIYCPVGAEGYSMQGNLLVPLNEEGWFLGGMVVFKTAQDYGNVACIPGTYEVLAVSGGGKGGTTVNGRGGGGGGGGGFLYDEDLNILSETIAVVVGAGATVLGGTGSSSTFGSLSPVGGGCGGNGDEANGVSGGSGGGGSGHTGTGGNGTAGPPLQGYGGGNAASNVGGGGGGASEVGENAVAHTTGGKGGDGTSYFGFKYGAGGGGRNMGGSNHGAGGDDGGGAGDGSPGVANTGGGGGGGTTGNTGGNGGSGIIIVRWGGYSHNYNPAA